MKIGRDYVSLTATNLMHHFKTCSTEISLNVYYNVRSEENKNKCILPVIKIVKR